MPCSLHGTSNLQAFSLTAFLVMHARNAYMTTEYMQSLLCIIAALTMPLIVMQGMLPSVKEN